MSPTPPQPADDRERLNEWVQQFAGTVRGYLLGVVRRADAADDLAQEVFRRAWQARERYVEQGQPRAYLLRIADRLACDYLRRRRPELQLDEIGWGTSEPVGVEPPPEASLERDETLRQLAAALDLLSEPQRRVVLLRYYGELEFAAIAEALECPLSTVLSHCHRGLKALRKRLVEK